MDDNSIIMKIFNYSWFAIALMPMFGGLGFIFAGWRVNYTRWMDEGIIYMIPFILISIAVLNTYVVYLAIILWFVGIIRAIMILRPYKEKLTQKQINKEYEWNNQTFESNYKSNENLNNQKHTHTGAQTDINNNKISHKKDFDKINDKRDDKKAKGRKLDL